MGPDAGEEEVKSAYRALSKKVHPDKNRAEGSTEAFKKLSVAYRSLLERGGAEESGNEEEESVPPQPGFQKWPWERCEEEDFNDWMRNEAGKQEERRRRDEIKFLISSALLLLLFAVLGVVAFPRQQLAHSKLKTKAEKRSQEVLIEELETQAQLFQHCSPARVTQCVLLFLPSLKECSQECRARHLKAVGRVKSGLKGFSWGWLWVEGGVQPELERALGGVEGVLLVVAKFGRGMRWRRRLGGTLSWEGEVETGEIREWVRRVGKGDEKGGARIEGEGMPKVLKTSGWLKKLFSWTRFAFL